MRPLLGFAAATVLGLAALALRPDLVADAGGEVFEASAGGGVTVWDEARPPPPVATTLQQAPYAVEGTTAGELLRSMSERAPESQGGTYFGLTVTELAFRYRHRRAEAGCALNDVQIDLSVRVSLPAWTPGPDAPYDLRRDWARFLSNLGRHEDRHRAIAEHGADAIRTALDGLSAPTCAAVDAEARAVSERIQSETDAAHRRYDDETGHGRTQGAVWP